MTPAETKQARLIETTDGSPAVVAAAEWYRDNPGPVPPLGEFPATRQILDEQNQMTVFAIQGAGLIVMCAEGVRAMILMDASSSQGRAARAYLLDVVSKIMPLSEVVERGNFVDLTAQTASAN